MGDLHLQHHDRNNDCDHAVAERLQPALGHLSSTSVPRAGPTNCPAVDINSCLRTLDPDVAAFYPVPAKSSGGRGTGEGMDSHCSPSLNPLAYCCNALWIYTLITDR